MVSRKSRDQHQKWHPLRVSGKRPPEIANIWRAQSARSAVAALSHFLLFACAYGPRGAISARAHRLIAVYGKLTSADIRTLFTGRRTACQDPESLDPGQDGQICSLGCFQDLSAPPWIRAGTTELGGLRTKRWSLCSHHDVSFCG